MSDLSTYLLYAFALAWFFFSLVRDRKKTEQALRRAWKSFLGILPPLAFLILLLSLVVVFLPQEAVAIPGGEEWIFGVFYRLGCGGGDAYPWVCGPSHGQIAP